MYPLEEVLTWEAEMADSLQKEHKILATYRWVRMDLTDRRATLLQEDTLDVLALDQLDQAILQVEEMIYERSLIIDEKEKAIETMYQQWQQLLQS
jgi:hypothetical protein